MSKPLPLSESFRNSEPSPESRSDARCPFLNNEKNFIVKTFGKLTVTKTLLFGEKRASKSQDASAVARRLGRGPIELWLAGNDQVDMYE